MRTGGAAGFVRALDGTRPPVATVKGVGAAGRPGTHTQASVSRSAAPRLWHAAWRCTLCVVRLLNQLAAPAARL